MRGHEVVSSLGPNSLPVLDALRFVDDDTVPFAISLCTLVSCNLGRLTNSIQGREEPTYLWPYVEHQSSAPQDVAWILCESLSA